MKRLLCGVVAIMTFFMCSCKKDDGTIQLSQLQPYKLDIVGARSLGLNNNHASSGSYGESGELYDRGLFKIDEQGNISTVALYLIDKEDGSSEIKDYKISVVPNEVAKISSGYLRMSDCSYYHEDGGFAFGFSDYKNLLVRCSDGLIFSVSDDVWPYVRYTTMFTETEDGALYLNDGKVVGKITVENGVATFRQINTTGSGAGAGNDFDTRYGSMYILKNGVICSMCKGHEAFLWPNGGFSYLDKYPLYFIEKGILYAPSASYDKSSDGYILSFHYVNVGDTPGNVSVTEPWFSFKYKYPNHSIHLGIEDYSCLETEKYYILSEGEGSFVVVVNKDGSDGKLVKAGFMPIFANRCKFEGKYWVPLKYAGGEPSIYWFDPNTLQAGHIKANIPTYSETDFQKIYIKSKESYDCSNGYITYETIRPSDGYNVTVKVDITTGRSEIFDRAPERLFAVFVTLS